MTGEQLFKNAIKRPLDLKISSITGFNELSKNLAQNEQVCFSFIAECMLNGKKKEVVSVAVSNSRIIYCNQKFIKTRVQSIMIDNVNDITYSSKLTGDKLVIDTTKELIEFFVLSNQTDKIKSEFNKVLFAPKESINSAPSTSYIDELKELASLRDAGIITEEEFQAKKTEILK